MACCGSKAAPATRSVATSHPAAPATGGMQSVQIAYTGGAVLHVAGPYSGRRYVFSSSASVQTVDARDAMTLLSVPGLRPHTSGR
jgi:hypothetical protein